MTAFIRYDVQLSEFTAVPFTDSAPGRRALVTITEVSGLQDDIVFVYKQIPAVNGSPSDSVFSHIASVVDQEDFPVGAPDSGDVWFRANQLDLVVATDEQIEEILEFLKQDLKLLANAADQLLLLENPSSEIAPSGVTETTPGGETVGEDVATLRIDFPVPLDVAPTGRVLVAISPSISFKVVAVDTNGFDLASNVTITSGHTVRWQVVP